MLNLDTHILVDFLRGELSSNELEIVADHELAISDIVLWELAKLRQLKRITIDLESRSFRKFLQRMTVFPITLEIAVRSCQLDFKSDPADELIAATTVEHDLPLLTRDQRIRTSKLVRFA